MLKLNGGLGTSMGMTRAKSLIEVKDGLSFLDVIARQVLELRRRTGARVPLLLMNSFYTHDDALAALERYPELAVEGIPLDFIQGKVPKLRADDLCPVSWEAEPALEWAPPGHGDIYTALRATGVLDTLLEHGFEYAFLSNSDNLGAVLDERILAWFAAERLPFAMEVADRTEADKKGGHPARRHDGGLILRETAQVADEDSAAYEDVTRHRFFNANNLWINLRALRRAETIDLPLIVNRKTVDPSDSSSTPVIQLETAMGAAIAAFEGAAVVRVPRRRFVPVKTTSDLVALRSDAYVLSEDEHVELAEGRSAAPLVELDSSFYKRLRDCEARFPDGVPSLVECERISIRGDVRFGAGVIARGAVSIEHDGTGQLAIEPGTVLEGSLVR